MEQNFPLESDNVVFIFTDEDLKSVADEQNFGLFKYTRQFKTGNHFSGSL